MKTTKINIAFLICISVITMLFAGCAGNQTKTTDETPTSGNIKIAVDEAYQLLFDTEIYTFEALYKQAKINAAYKPEGEAIELLMKDSARLVVSNRKLTDAEDKLLRDQKLVPRTLVIAHDALVFIVNNSNPDSLLLMDQVKEIFTGKTSKWSQIDKKSTLGDITVVFDNNKSCNTRFVREKFALKNNFPSNCYAVKSNPEVINFVEKNNDAIGIISVNWVSDKDDTISHDFLKRVKIVSLGDEGSDGSYYKPFQGNIAEGSYPMIRDVYMIKREPIVGLGTGFVQFVAGEKGQRIILKSGLVPATMPIRLVEVKH